MSFDKSGKNTGTRRKARESALQMMFSADVINPDSNDLTNDYWNELGDTESDPKTREFANNLVTGALANKLVIDDRIRTRAEHWRIERMAIVDRNVLRLAVYEFLFEDTPHTVVINEALEIARRFSTFEATQFINGILDAIKLDLEKEPGEPESKKKSKSSAN
ncbi:MAG TPA: transcription antitermination factor NusB [Pyrinomonadaceae bacterium]|nr:transcription antitermination factor NusB [Pyrinomonadaceae bacterium]